MSTVNLNLARKWRSRSFAHVVGQDLSVRMLKNSLYLNHYFPVYLFSGQRGCGKTTMARIFANAINCHQLESFQKDPRANTVPCLLCDSCLMMAQGNHPDFIEIDAASHTGVDNVRSIVEAASFLPLAGRKKVYLIDEAHMLSKAAFNAFLKILEEPPCTVLFILATTDVEKIIDTVRSRSFQLFFKAIPAEPLLVHLENICQQENIPYESTGLLSIIQNTEGSARDALNLIEQVRFSYNKISKHAVAKLLGHCSEDTVIGLFTVMIQGSVHAVLKYSGDNVLSQYNALSLWKNIGQLLRALLWLGHDLPTDAFTEYHESLKVFNQKINAKKMTELLQIWCDYERLLLRTSMPYESLEMMFVIMTRLCNDINKDSVQKVPQALIAHSSLEKKTEQLINSAPKKVVEQPSNPSAVTIIQEKKIVSKNEEQWQAFVAALNSLQEPLLLSVFKHARFVDSDREAVTIAFAQEFSFFNELLENAQVQWKPLLAKAFNNEKIMLNRSFTDPKSPDYQTPVRGVEKIQEKKSNYSPSFAGKSYKPRTIVQETIIDVSDSAIWKKATMLLQVFAGICVEVKEKNS